MPFPQTGLRRAGLGWAFLSLAAIGAFGAAVRPIATPIREAFIATRGSGRPDRIGQTATLSGVLLSDPIPLSAGSALADLQDDSGAATLFSPNRDLLIGRVQRGDLVVARGKISVYDGNDELVLTDIGRIGRAPLPQPKEVRIADLLAGKDRGELVRLTGTLQAGPASADREVLLRDPSGEIPVLVAARFFTDKEFAARFSDGGRVAVVGISNRFGRNGRYRILPRDDADFHFAPLPPYRLLGMAGAGLLLAAYAAYAARRRRQREHRTRSLREDARRAAEERDRFFTLSLDMLCIATRDSQIKRLNPAFSETLGWSDADILARPALDFVHPDDHAATTAALAELAAGKPLINFENRWLRRNGLWRVLSWRAVPEGDVIYATARDVTDQREASSALRALNEDLEQRVLERTAEAHQALATLDATEDGAFIFDPDSLRFTYVNEGAVRQVGYPRAQLLEMTPLDIDTKGDEAAFRALLVPMLRGECRSRQIATYHRHRDGRQIPVEINLQYVAPAGRRPWFISMVRDITERRKAESLVRRSQRLDALGTLAGGVAHDINNALTPIMMALEVLRAKYPDDTQLIDTVQSSASRGSDMVRQLLGFAKRPEGNPTEIVPARLLEEIQQITKYTFPKNLRVVLACRAGVPSVRGDPTQLHRVLLNLCFNARDAMPEGGTLTLETAAVELDASDASHASMPDAEPGPYALLRVSDTGTGMTPEVVERIFDPFFTTKPPDKGTGLGLSTAIAIVRGIGGFLRVETQLGKGSSFSVYLPASKAERTVDPQPAPAQALRGQSEKIMVVDDEPAVRTVFALVLRRLHFDPILAIDGEDGLVQAARHRSTLRAIITDLHMPAMGGLEFVRALRLTEPDLPVLVTSGRLEEAEREGCSRLGVRGFIEKPFTESQLAALLDQAFTGVSKA